jgi:hypothetical protein
MEINKSSASHFYQGIDNQSSDLNGDYENNFGIPYDSLVQRNPSANNGQFANNETENTWKMESLECKQEIDATSYNNNLMNDESMNYGDNYNENTFQNFCYNSNSSSNSNAPPFFPQPSTTSNINSQSQHPQTYKNNAYGPYQLSTSPKSQLSLPTWYNPPQHPSQQFYPATQNFYPHHPAYHQPSFGPPIPTTPSSDHNMRNMIQMTNR